MKNKEAQGIVIQCPICNKEVYRDKKQLAILFDDTTIFSGIRKLFNTNYFGLAPIEDTPRSKKHKELLKVGMLKSISHNDKEIGAKICSFFYPCGCLNETIITSTLYGANAGYYYEDDDEDSMSGWLLPTICS